MPKPPFLYFICGLIAISSLYLAFFGAAHRVDTWWGLPTLIVGIAGVVVAGGYLVGVWILWLDDN